MDSRDESIKSKDVEAATAPEPILSYHEAVPVTIDPAAAGVAKIDALYSVMGRGYKLWILYASIGLICYSYSLSSNTVYVYEPFSTSAYGQHTIVGTIAVVNSIISAVCKPFLAKLADLTSRPTAFVVSLVFYCIGFILISASTNVGMVVGGQLLDTIGGSGITFMQGVIVSDISSLQWRGMASALAASPYILNAFIAGYISSAISLTNWRWGYGMFIIIVPACMAPALAVLYWAQRRGRQMGVVVSRRPESRSSFITSALKLWSLLDAFGLLLMGTGFTLILLPFTLYTTATGGFRNPSLIAMFVVGAVLLIAWMLWESLYAAHPIQPRSMVLNRTFLCCLVIDFMYYLSFYVGDTYLNSWIYVVKDWSTRDYNFFINTLGVGLCFFGLVAGLIQRYTHRYKYLQMSGLAIRAIGQGIKYHAALNGANTAELIVGQILCGLGGGFSVIGSQVANQACVSHAFMAQAMSLLSLWTNVGGGVGSAIGAALWNNKLPRYLSQELGDVLSGAELSEIFGSIAVAREAQPRAQVVKAYNHAISDMLLPSVILCLVPLIAGALTSNYALDDRHNAVEDKKVVVREQDELEATLRA